VRHTKETVLGRVRDEYRALDRVVRRLGPADFARPAFGERARLRFSVKDVLAHITAWKWSAERSLAGARGPRRPVDPPKLGTIGEINAALYRRSHRRPASAVVADHRAAQRALVRAIRSRPDAFFSERERSPQWPFDAVGHSAEHRIKHLEPLVDRKRPPARHARRRSAPG